MGWETLSNGVLLKRAADAGFEAFISVDKNIEYEQNLPNLPLPVIVIDASSNALQSLIPFASSLLELLARPLDRALFVVVANGAAMRLTSPRT